MPAHTAPHQTTPHSTVASQVYSIFSMLIGGFMFGVIIGSLTNIIGDRPSPSRRTILLKV
jgi:F0F1-type ATP synthase assembly protein I